eukprot:TRINITY_DN1247_c1_g1_i2.p1 TRINITY_DN1247_c1_g1~~TRINITY_DN1247_c1_g1_i2.p1  ORF type:complete len:108 (-),score=11.66 TRINITY_DN1247_c1_g1_i2:720-1043(-)
MVGPHVLASWWSWKDWKISKMERESNKQAKKESKHALDVQHGSHTSHSMPNIEVSMCANYSRIFQGQQIQMAITLKPCVGLCNLPTVGKLFSSRYPWSPRLHKSELY